MSRWGRRDLSLGVAFAVITFVGHSAMADWLDSRQLFALDDMLFEADPASRLDAFSHYWLRAPLLAHPNLAHFVNPPIRLVARVLSVGDLTGRETRLRRTLGLMVAPLASSLTAATIFAVLRGIQATRGEAALLCGLALVSFSRIVFGSMPEAFALTGLALAAAYGAAADTVRRAGTIRWWPWLAVSVFATGVTVTNLASICILFCCTLLFTGHPIAVTLAMVARLMIATLILTVVLVAAGTAVYGKSLTLADELSRRRAYMVTNGLERVLRFPATMVDTFVSPMPVVGYRPYFANPELCLVRVGLPPPSQSFPDRSVVRIVTFLALIIALVSAWKGPTPERALAVGSLGIVVLNVGLHTVWGENELFLYSQHWHVPVLFAVFGAMTAAGGTRAVTAVGLAMCIGAIGASNAATVWSLATDLSLMPPIIRCGTQAVVPISAE